MNPDDEKLFGCPVCGFKVTGAEDGCPRCGAKFADSTRFECPFCGEHVDPHSPTCPSCFVSYQEFHLRRGKRDPDESIDSLLTEIIALESEQVRQEDKHLSCPKCSWLLAGNEEKCPKCGERFHDQVSYQCPICAALVRADAVKCSDCGTLFVEQEVPPMAEDEAEEDRGARPGALPAHEAAALGAAPDRALPQTRPEAPPRPARAEDEGQGAPAKPRPKVELRHLESAPPAEQPPAGPEREPGQRKRRTRKLKPKS